MKNKIIRVFEEQSNRVLFGNFLSLSILQLFTYALPLLTLPYLINTLGVEVYGLVIFAQAFTMYFNIIVDYGFNLSATKSISINREDDNKISEIYNSVMAVKLILVIFSFIVLSIFLAIFDRFMVEWRLFYISFVMVVGQALFPVWFFQGMERMKYIMKINIASKIFFTALIFLLVHGPDDYLIVPLLNSLGFLASGVYSVFLIRRKFNIRFRADSIRLLYYFKSGYIIFVSTLFTSFYRLMPINILGFLQTMEMVAVYSLAEKVIRTALSFYQPLIQSFFPFIGRKFEKSIDSAMRANMVLLFVGLPFTLCASILLFVLSEWIVLLLGGPEMVEASALLKIFSPLLVIVFIANIFGSQIMLHTGLENEFKNTLRMASVFSCFLFPFGIGLYDLFGAVISVVFVESYIMLAFVFSVVCRRDQLFSSKH